MAMVVVSLVLVSKNTNETVQQIENNHLEVYMEKKG